MPISAPNLLKLREQKHTLTANLSVVKGTTLLAATVTGSPARGDRAISYTSGTGQFSLIRSYQMVLIGTTPGGRDVDVLRLKSISGTASSGSITFDEHGIDWQNGYHITIKHLYIGERVLPRISGGVFSKFYDVTYTDQNSSPPPVCIAGPHQAGRRDPITGEIVFNIDLTDSYPVAAGATIVSYGLSVSPATGVTVVFNTGTGIGTVTINTEGEYWAVPSCTDSNGKTQERFVALVVDDTPYTNYELTSYSASYGGGINLGLRVFGDDIPLSDFPDEALVIEWYDNFFDDVEGYVNELGVGDNIITTGYIRSYSATHNFVSSNLQEVSFEITTPDNLLDNIHLFGSISLEAVASPTAWYQYNRTLTVGRAIHHLLKWHSSILELTDVVGLLSNSLLIKAGRFEPGSLRQMCNDLADNKGIFAKLTSDRTGRLHLAEDIQMFNTGLRAAVATVMEITEQDVAGPVQVQNKEAGAVAANVSGAHFDGLKTTFIGSMIPGYESGGTRFGLGNRRGTSPINRQNQVLASQTDCNEKAGRLFAQANRNLESVIIPFRGAGYLGALTTIPAWYEIDFTNVNNYPRGLNLDQTRMICRSVRMTQPRQGDAQLTATFEPEVFGPDGIPWNYRTGIPQPPNPPSPKWTAPKSLPALLSFSSVNYRDDNDADWTSIDSGSYNHGCVDLWWRVKEQTANPEKVIWLGVGDAGLINYTRGINGVPIARTPGSPPPNTWADGNAPTVANMNLVCVVSNPFIESSFAALGELQEGGLWRGWLLVTFDNFESGSYIELYDGVTLPDEIRPLWCAINSDHILVTLWAGDDTLRLLDFDPVLLTYTDEYALGAATITQVNDRDYIAYPFAPADDVARWYVYGRLNAPQALANPEHIITTANGGTSWASFLNTWGTDYCASLYVGFDDGAANRKFWAVRQMFSEGGGAAPTTPPASSAWTLAVTNAAMTELTHDDTYVYGRDTSTSTSLKRYDPSDDSVTVIHTSGDTTGTQATPIVVFNNELYMATGGSNIIRVYKFSGTPGTWNEVFNSGSLDPLITFSRLHLWATPTHIMLCTGQQHNDNSRYYGRKSTDGSSWSAFTFVDGTSGNYDPTDNSPAFEDPNQYKDTQTQLSGKFIKILYGGFSSIYGFGKWNGTNLEVVDSSESSAEEYFPMPWYHFRKNGSSWYYRNDEPGVEAWATGWTAIPLGPLSETVTPAPQTIGGEYPFGWSVDGTDWYVHYFFNGQWSDAEFVITAAGNGIAGAVTLSDGTMILALDAGAGAIRFIKRDAPV